MKKTAITIVATLCLSLNHSKAQVNSNESYSNEINASISDFPKYVNTGNAEVDALNYETQKKQWIASNPRAYEALLNAPSIDGLPGFPKLIRTGNDELDQKVYRKAKEDWYASNKDLVEMYYAENAKKYPSRKD
jgi:hypothetical protein